MNYETENNTSETIITGLFTLSGAMLGGIIAYFIGWDVKEVVKLKTQVNNLSKQIISYCNLEVKYSENLVKLKDKLPLTMLKEYKETIKATDLWRPTMNANEAKKILTKNL